MRTIETRCSATWARQSRKIRLAAGGGHNADSGACKTGLHQTESARGHHVRRVPFSMG
jgi:hypothetical protein